MTHPRIVLISALAQSPGPAMAAMGEEWPEACHHNLIDDSLASDFAKLGAITPAIVERFLTLGRYAAGVSDGQHSPAGVMFTCSAFRPAIDRVKADLAIPVISPNEGAFEEALDLCAAGERLAKGPGRVALVLSFSGSLEPLTDELTAIAAQRESQAWTKDAGQFIPNPSTWLNQGRWQDEPDSGQQSIERGSVGMAFV